ncbi:DUF5753 domain-containing protein [Streptomyces sp. HNM0574]|uniref:DUF5753 domain-containing protein n=1 Tax=Streptomyces sp. HNM0574 TaxID=2714954 RepID=UPI00146B55ED|nr:DUF5753 domain-containing protein [Streptomyces sp. HNM0574]NLU67033.1 XRE family transcriptional regulator [Streptomyces sp. HNM0574]
MADSAELPANLRYLGNQFRLWRVDAGVAREAAAEAVGYSLEMVKSVECGRRKCPPKMALIGDELFGAGGKLKAGLKYQEPEKYSEKAQDFLALERTARCIWAYEMGHVPGLLQIAEHARALLSAHCPPLGDETVERRVAGRVERQHLLSTTAEEPVELACVLLETALRVSIGGKDVHRKQLLHLLERGKQRNVSLQVLPVDRVPPTALDGPLVVLETHDDECYGYMEGHTASSLTSDPRDISSLLRRHGTIRMQALSAEESTEYIEGIVQRL